MNTEPTGPFPPDANGCICPQDFSRSECPVHGRMTPLMSDPSREPRGEGEGIVSIARCPEHGLHGERTECFVCGGPVEQVPMVPVARWEVIKDVCDKLDEIAVDLGPIGPLMGSLRIADQVERLLELRHGEREGRYRAALEAIANAEIPGISGGPNGAS